MRRALTEDDTRFKEELESYRFPIEKFDHAAHVRLATIYLMENELEEAVGLMQDFLVGYLTHCGVDGSKYSAELTREWVARIAEWLEEKA